MQRLHFWFFLVWLNIAHSARILGVFHLATWSHYQLGNKIIKELAARGHEVTVIAPFEEKEPINNYKNIFLDGVFQEVDEMKTKNIFAQTNWNAITKVVVLDLIGLLFVEHCLNHTNVQEFLKLNQTFDLVIVEHFMNAAMVGFCYHYKAPCVLTSGVGANRWTNPPMGNPGLPSYVPDVYLYLSHNMGFWERLSNLFVYIVSQLFSQFYTLSKHNSLLQRYFPGAPHFHELYYNSSLMFVNSHIAMGSAFPQVPNMIDIGGYHLETAKELPADLKAYLDDATEGVVLFNVGSSIKSKAFPTEKRDAIIKAFSKLNCKVLMRWDEETLPGLPSNIQLSKWLPQTDVLAHPNIKIFVHHGGLLSLMEGLYYGKPFVAIPIFGDHKMNTANGINAGYGIGITFDKLTEESLSSALNKILTDKKYTENAQRRSKIMKDQSMGSLEKAIFWIEYVIRHQGAPHLKTQAVKLPIYQYLLLDVIAFVVVTLVMCLCILRKIINGFL